MAGKLSEGVKDLKIGSKQSPKMVKVSSKSILSYQNGSASSVENRVCDLMDSPRDEVSEEKSTSDSTSCADQDLKSECLDLVRKKLISDLSLHVFYDDLESKLIKMEPMEIGKERLSVIQKLLVQISQLSDAEKLLLYLKLPSSTSSPFDPLRQPLNPLGNRQEIQQTIVWIKTHLEEDREISIPKQDVYDQYLKYCENASMKPLSTADFGKVMKQVYPGVRPRRLGTRGNSRYCYSGMRNTSKLPTPVLPALCKLANGNARNVSSPVRGQESEKSKKGEKSKRKWKTSTSRSGKCVGRSTKAGGGKDGSLKNAKRTKVAKETETAAAEWREIKVECEESSSVSFEKAEEGGDRVLEEEKKAKAVRKPGKAAKKAYVPIQPKPPAPRAKVHFGVGSGALCCEESDSQEPEEEIVRYFRHLEESQILGAEVMQQAVESAEKNLVQIKNSSQGCWKAVSEVKKEEADEEGNGSRSKSCLEGQSSVVKPPDAARFAFPQRSQSSVDLTSNKEISHLRLLLEKSITDDKTGEFPVDVAKSKVASPNARSKYFNFTPISPGPTTPVVSPFVSPRNTPATRSHLPETVTGFPKVRAGLYKAEGHALPVQMCRPRSNSSTNFCRAKARRNLSKVLSCDQMPPRQDCPDGFAMAAAAAAFPFHLTGQVCDSLSTESRQLPDAEAKDLHFATSRSQSVPLNRMTSEGSWFGNPAYNQYLNAAGGYVTKDLDTLISGEAMQTLSMHEAFARSGPPPITDLDNHLFTGGFETDGAAASAFVQDPAASAVFPGKMDINANATFETTFANESDSIADTFKSLLPSFDPSKDLGGDNSRGGKGGKLFGDYDSGKDPVITAFKPVLMGGGDFCQNPTQPLGFFAPKTTSDDNQLIEFLGLDA